MITWERDADQEFARTAGGRRIGAVRKTKNLYTWELYYIQAGDIVGLETTGSRNTLRGAQKSLIRAWENWMREMCLQHAAVRTPQ